VVTPYYFAYSYKPSIEPRIKVVFFAAVAGATEGLQVANVVATAAGQGDDVID
jgi:hypothetical protein